MSLGVGACAHVYKNNPHREHGTPGRGEKIEGNVSIVNQDTSQPPNNGLLRRGEGRKVKCFHPFNGEGLRWGVFKKWKSDSRGKTKTENSGEKKETCFLCLRFLRQHTKPLSRDVSVISSVRWPVPGEVITLNRFTSDTDPGSYRCLHSC